MSHHMMTRHQQQKFAARKDPNKKAYKTKKHGDKKKQDPYRKYQDYRFMSVEDL